MKWIERINFVKMTTLPKATVRFSAIPIHSPRAFFTKLDQKNFESVWRRKWQPTPVFLPGESQGQRSLVSCSLCGHTESDTAEVTQQQQQQHGNTKDLE